LAYDIRDLGNQCTHPNPDDNTMIQTSISQLVGIGVGCLIGNLIYAGFTGKYEAALDHSFFQFATLFSVWLTWYITQALS